MPSLVVIGAQWGDEGKGKLVDYLTASADAVVRFQGGNNAGHTLVVGADIFKLHLIPSGILRADCKCYIGAGVVVDPQVLFDEVQGLLNRNIKVSPKILKIDRDAQLILPYHQAIDLAREEVSGNNKIGTTGRGIGPAYEDRANRTGVRFAELTRIDELKEKLKTICEEKSLYLKSVLGVTPQFNFESIWEVVVNAAERFVPFLSNASLEINELLDNNGKVLFEGAQGTLLDQAHGTVPFVTSSNTIAGAVSTGVGVGPKKLDYILGIAKAYSTRVGSGPFPTEQNNKIGELLVKVGAEYGTTTGRQRRCGWFDAFALKRAVRLNGFDSIALTKLDVLSGFETIKICVSYKLNGKKLDDIPSLASELSEVEPQYIELKGWQADITKAKKWHHLPMETRFYISTIAEIVGCPVTVLSVGPERESTIFCSNSNFIKNFFNREI